MRKPGPARASLNLARDDPSRPGPPGRSGCRYSPRGLWRRRLSKSVAKARIEPERAKRIVDILHFSSLRSCRGGPLQQIWTRSRSGPPQESHPHHPAPARPRHRADPGSRVIAPGEKGSVKVIRRAVMRARGAGSTMCIVVMLFCLDHLCSIGLLACDGTIRVLLNHSRSVGPPGWSRTPRVRNAHLGVRGVRGPAPQSARSSGNPRARASSRRSRGLSDVLAGWRRHDMRDAVPPCKTIGGVERGGRTAPDAVRPR